MTPCIYDFKDILADLESVRDRNLLKILESDFKQLLA